MTQVSNHWHWATCFSCFHISGYGVFSIQQFEAGDFLLQYVGEKISVEEAERRQKRGAENKMFFYKYNGKEHWLVMPVSMVKY